LIRNRASLCAATMMPTVGVANAEGLATDMPTFFPLGFFNTQLQKRAVLAVRQNSCAFVFIRG
jgi:hypothetical protein